jgi:threonine dehydrogenase-like Zn-dependent dehydrogenase
VELVDVEESRASIAAQLGVGFATPATAARDADAVLHASGTSAGLQTALGLAGLEATVVELSWFGTHAATLLLGGAFHAQRLTLKSSQVGRVAPAQRARWTHARRLRFALSLLDDGVLDALLTGECAFGDLPARMPKLMGEAGGTLCHCVRYDTGDAFD